MFIKRKKKQMNIYFKRYCLYARNVFLFDKINIFWSDKSNVNGMSKFLDICMSSTSIYHYKHGMLIDDTPPVLSTYNNW